VFWGPIPEIALIIFLGKPEMVIPNVTEVPPQCEVSLLHVAPRTKQERQGGTRPVVDMQQVSGISYGFIFQEGLNFLTKVS